MDVEKIDAALERNRDGAVMLFKTMSTDYIQATTTTMRRALERDAAIIYVAFQWPYQSAKRIFAENGIDCSDIEVVDCITRSASPEGVEEAERVSYLAHPQDLMKLSKTISGLIGDEQHEGCVVVFDSLSTMLQYNTVGDLERFLDRLDETIRDHSLRCLMFTVGPTVDADLIGHEEAVFDDIALVTERDSNRAALVFNNDRVLVTVPEHIVETVSLQDADGLVWTIKNPSELVLRVD